jgi:hypothetical protein
LFVVSGASSAKGKEQDRVGYTLEGQEAGQLDHFAKLCKILHAILDFLQSISNGIRLMNDLKNRVAHGALKE